MTTTAYRLPRDVLPVDYAIDLDASVRRSTFSGTLVLTARVVRSVTGFELNARDLRVADVQATAGNKRLPGKAKLHRDRETVELTFGAPLPKGKVVVRLKFRGKLNPNMHGLYLARDGDERALVSQCEATDARAIFPCFDEPDLKATLEWTVRTDPGYEVITNGVLESRRRVKGSPAREVHRFKRTKVVSTYLAAVTIGRYELTPPKMIRRIPCRIAAAPGKQEQTEFATEVTAQVLPWFESYFGHRYNFGKLDQVAVAGFDAGAMENIGAIFYRQNLLLMRPGAVSWFGQKRIAEVIAHEIAHQWFGNLVTMKWWDDLWLNEAFATWIAYKAVNEWRPDWRIWDDSLESKEGAFAADALVNTHPIYTPVATPAEATELFDLITYEKGCAVLRMAESFLGHASFQSGIQSYIDTFKNDNATGRDLWSCLAKASGQPVDTLMQSWITQEGFPLVSMNVRPGGTGTTLHFTQRRFFANAERMAQENDACWQIPMVVRYGVGDRVHEQRVLMRDRELVVELPHAVSWVFPNAQASGFYRSELDADALQRITSAGLQHLTAAERKCLIEDQWALVRSGRSNVAQFMNVLSAFRGDEDYLVLRTLVARLQYLDQNVVHDEHRALLGAFARWLFAPSWERTGWDPQPQEGPERSVFRASLLEGLGDLGRDPELLAQAVSRLPLEMKDPTAVEPNLAGTLVALAAVQGDAARLAEYVAIYQRRKKEGAPPQLQARYLNALSAFEDPAVAARVLDLCLNGTVPQEQLRVVLGSMLSRRATQVATWAFLKQHWSNIGPKAGAMGIARLVETTGCLPLDLADDVAAFFRENPVEEAKRALQKALEAMALRRELVGREAGRLGTWLRQQPHLRMVG